MTRPPVFLALTLVLGLGAACPAEASTIPPLDLPAGHTAVAVGATGPSATVSLDHAFAPGLVGGLGVFTAPGSSQAGLYGAGRLSWAPTATPERGGFGLLLSAGGGMSPWSNNVTELFVQPAGTVAAVWGPVALRFTLGPALVFMVRTADRTGGISYFDPTPSATDGKSISIIPLVPNAELGLRLHPHHEIVVGGLSFVSWRGRF